MASDLFEAATLATRPATGDLSSTRQDGGPPAGEAITVYVGAPVGLLNASVVALPQVAVDYAKNDFLFDYYFRVWIIPSRLVRNPRINVDIPFDIWNAFPYANTLTAINATGNTGVTLDLTAPSLFKAVEYRTVNLRLLSTAPLSIEAHYDFVFTLQTRPFDFIANRVSLVSITPEVPVRETWEWLTDVIKTENGREQRIGLRTVPRRTQQSRVIALVSSEVDNIVDQNMFDYSSEVLIPYFQYGTHLTVDAAIGASTIVFDEARTDIRDGEYALLLNHKGEQLIKFVDVIAGTIDDPLTIDAPAGTLVVPLFYSVVRDGSVVKRKSVNGVAEATVDAMASQHRASFRRPTSSTSLALLDNLVIFDKRPLANQDPEETFYSGTRILDYDTGYLETRTDWVHTFVSGARQYLIRRVTDPSEMDFWRDFLDYTKGSLNPFLTPTYRDDLYTAEVPAEASGQLVLDGNRYSSRYFLMNSHKYLRLWTAGGPHDCKVLSAGANADNNDVIIIDPHLPAGVEWTDIQHVSFLIKSRLGDDRVELNHYATETVLSLSLRTIDE